jgi:hypothetical protein
VQGWQRRLIMDYSKYEKGFNEYWDTRIDTIGRVLEPIAMNLMYSEALRAWERSGRDELLARCLELEKVLDFLKVFVKENARSNTFSYLVGDIEALIEELDK